MQNSTNENVPMFASTKSDSKDDNPDQKELKSKRDQYIQDIRKKKRNQELGKKRNLNSDADKFLNESGNQSFFTSNSNAELKAHIDECIKKEFTLDDLHQIVECSKSKNLQDQFYVAIGTRKILSIDHEDPEENLRYIDCIIQAQLIEVLIQYMKNDLQHYLQLESAWALTNIACGNHDQTEIAVDKGAIEAFARLLNHNKNDILEQALWGIGNIAGDCTTYRNICVDGGAINKIVQIVSTTKSKQIIKHGVFALSNLCRGRPFTKFEYTKPTLPIFEQILVQEYDPETMTDTTYALAAITEGNAEQAACILQTEIPRGLLKQITSPFPTVVIPTLRSVGNLFNTTDEISDILIEKLEDLVKKVFTCLTSKKTAIRREALWCLSNIASGPYSHVEQIVGDAKILESVITLASSETVQVSREAAYVIANCTNPKNLEQASKMMKGGLVVALESLLLSSDSKSNELALDAMGNLLKVGARYSLDNNCENPILTEMENAGLVKILLEMQDHKSEEVYHKLMKLLDDHFELEDTN